MTPVVVLAQGRWYITAGLNPLFDTFDCQEHFFGVPEPGKLYGKINWRIPKGNRDFIERSTVQTFDQVQYNLSCISTVARFGSTLNHIVRQAVDWWCYQDLQAHTLPWDS